MEEISTIFDYLRCFSADIGQRIVESYPPLHSPSDPASPLLQDLKRRPLAAQELAIMGMAKYLKNHDAGKVVAEMGTGKTLMSIATCYVHANRKQFTSLVMCPPHLTKKWSREVFLTLPNTRVFLIDDMRNGGDPKKPHGGVEVILKDGEIVRKGARFSVSDLRRMGRAGWRRYTRQNTFFVLSKEKGKLGYFWRESYQLGANGRNMGSVL